MKNSLKFNAWVEEFGGVKKLSHTLWINSGTIYNWLNGKNSPKSETINTLIEMSNNKLTFDIIFKETTRNKE